MSTATRRLAVDEPLPLTKLVPFGLQHVLVMAASPISSVFLVSKTLGLSPSLTVDLLSAAFFLSGLGSLLQSLGVWTFGARLPFVMLPGGAPIALFLLIAKGYDLPTASGSVILTGLFYFLVLPAFARLLRFFPTLVVGTMIVIIGVNLIRISGSLVTGQPGTPEFANLRDVLLALATVGFTVLFFRLLAGMLRQLAVLLGLVAGAAVAALVGAVNFGDVLGGPLVGVPTLLPFGVPRFDLLAALPLMIFSVASMAEATGQTVVNAEIVGKEIDPRRDVPRTIRGDALISLLGGFLGTSLMVTSGENIGIVHVSGVRSRFVTAAAGVFLVLIGLLAPIGRLINAIPAPVVGGTALVVYAIITVIGINLLRRVDLSEHTNVIVATVGLVFGLLPILVPDVYNQFPPNARILLGSGVAMGAFAAAAMNILFNYVGHPSRHEAPQQVPGRASA